MKHFATAFVGAGFLALAACGGQGDDTAADNVEDAAEANAEMLEDMADNATNEMVEDNLEMQADAVEENGEQQADAIDDADPIVNQ